MKFSRYLISILCLLLFAGCGSGSDDPIATNLNSGNSAPAQQFGRVVIQSTLLRAVPSIVEEFRISGFDSNGELQFGPEVVNKAPVVELLMPTSVVRVQVDYLVQGQPIGVADVPVVVVADEVTNITEPVFQDTVDALTSLGVPSSTFSLANGTSATLQVNGNFNSGAQSDFSNLVTWTSSNTGVATVDAVGTLQTLTEGQTTITATFDTLSVTINVTVSPATVTTLAVTPSPLSLALGTSNQMIATATFTDGTQQDVSTTATWSSDASGVATVDTSGLLQTVGQGSANITATFGGTSGSSGVTVTAAELTRIDITPANPSLANGTNQQLTATGVFTDQTTQDLSSTVTWTVANTSFANVTTLGLLTGVGEGSTSVSATTGGITGATNVTVTPAVVTSVVVTPGNPSLPNGTAAQLTATANFSDGSQQDVTNTAAWTSSTTANVTVSSTGLITGQNVGSSDVTAIFSGNSGSVTASVTPAIPVSVAVAPQNQSIALGTSLQFNATVTFSDNSTQDVSNTASWTSSQTGVASITTTGLASSVAEGSTTISVNFSGQSTSTTLTVTPAEIASIAVTPTTPSIALGTTQQFVATATLTDSTTQDITNSASWTSGTPGVATINTTGLATSVSQGQATITATANGQSGSTTLDVTAPTVVSLAVTPPTASIPVGLTQGFTATATFSDNSTQDVTTTAVWTSTQTGVATVNTTGLATALSVGNSNIGASFGGQSDSAALTVTAAEIVSITVTPTDPSVALGTTQRFVATATLTDNSTQDVSNTANWSSSMPVVATVNTTGLATSASTGTTTITAMVSGVSGSTTLTVTPAVVVSVAILPINSTIIGVQTQQFTATATFSDTTTQDVTNTANWSSSMTGVATIDTTGLASGVSAGSTTISATFSGQTGGTTLTVSPATVVSVAILPTNPSINDAQTQQFTATATFNDSTTQDVTNTATWSSSTNGVATINTTGLASGVSAGSTTITATFGGQSDSTSLTVTSSVTVQSIAVTPGQAVTTPGTSRQYTAIATFSDTTTADVTSSATWSSSSTDVTVSTSGLASVSAAATRDNDVTITATLSAVSGSANLTVKQIVFVPSLTFGPEAIPVFSNGSLSSQSSNATALGKIIAVHPNGSFFYAVDATTQLIHSYTYDNFGTLTEVGTALATGDVPADVEIDTTGQFVYVANQGDGSTTFGSVSSYSISADGSLTFLNTQTYTNNVAATELAVNDRALYLLDPFSAEVVPFSIAGNGALTELGNVSVGSMTNTHQLAADPTNNYIYVSLFNPTLSRLELLVFSVAADGSLTLGRTDVLTNEFSDMAINPAGTILIATDRTNNVVLSHTIGAGGALTQVTSTLITLASDPTSNAFTPTGVSIGAAGRFAFVITVGDFQITSFEIAGGGSISQVGTETPFFSPTDVAVSP